MNTNVLTLPPVDVMVRKERGQGDLQEHHLVRKSYTVELGTETREKWRWSDAEALQRRAVPADGDRN